MRWDDISYARIYAVACCAEGGYFTRCLYSNSSWYMQPVKIRTSRSSRDAAEVLSLIIKSLRLADALKTVRKHAYTDASTGYRCTSHCSTIWPGCVCSNVRNVRSNCTLDSCDST